MSLDTLIDQYFSAKAYAVAGASEDPDKYGHKCYVALLARGFTAYPLNPKSKTILGNPAYVNLAALPEKAQSLSIVTPPQVTEKVVDEAIAQGVKTIWMQPGAESPAAIKRAEKAGVGVIAGGPCLLVELAVRGGRK